MLQIVSTYPRKFLFNSRRVMGKSKSKRINIDYGNIFDSDEDFFLSGSFGYSTSAPTQANAVNYMKSQMQLKNKDRERDSDRPIPQIKPRNEKQKEFLDILQNPAYPIVVATGCAGGGKTHLASLMGLKNLHEQNVQRLIITRPAVSVDEDHGFLPGTLEEKMAPWVAPLYDSFYTFYSPKKVQSLIEDKTIEICPLAYTRGRTFNNAWIIADECQNTTPIQMKMLLTRIGQGSTMVITGDLAQSDLHGTNGLQDLIRRLDTYGTNTDKIARVHFGMDDIVRHPVIKDVLNLYKNPF